MFRVTLDGMIAVFLAIILCSFFFAWVAAEIFQKGRENRRKKVFRNLRNLRSRLRRLIQARPRGMPAMRGDE